MMIVVLWVSVGFIGGLCFGPLILPKRYIPKTNKFGNFEPINTEKQFDPLVRPPFYIGNSVGERQ
jgi:hypothetical protein